MARPVSPLLLDRRYSGSLPGQFMWDLWWAKWQWDRFLSEYFAFLLSVSFHRCSTLIRSSINDAIWSWQSTASLSNICKKEIPALYRNRWFITVFVTVRHWFLSRVKLIQPTLSHPIFQKSNLILSTHLRHVLKEISFHEVSLLKSCTHVPSLPRVPNSPSPPPSRAAWFRYTNRQIVGDKSLPKLRQSRRPCVTFRNMPVFYAAPRQPSTRQAMYV
jgi:hypothetical protein